MINRMKAENAYLTSAKSPWRTLHFFLITALAIIASVGVALAQGTAGPAASPTASATTSPTPSGTATPIPLPEIVAQAETVTGNLRNIDANVATDQITTTVNEELPTLIREIDSRLSENEKILNSRPSLETLRNLEADWKTLRKNVPVWTRELTERATELDREIDQLAQLDRVWSMTLEQAQSVPMAPQSGQQPQVIQNNDQGAAPPEILQRMQSVIAAIRQTRDSVEKQRTQILTLQNRTAEQDARLNEAIASVNRVRDQTINRLFIKDSPPIWATQAWSRAGHDLLEDSQNSFSTQWTALGAYTRHQSSRFILHAIISLLMMLGLYWTRRRVQPFVAAEPTLEGVARVFHTPIATALVLSLLTGGWVYPQAPRMLSALLGAAALVPTIIVLRQLIERHLFTILNALVVFYFVDQVRAVSAALPVLSRLLFMAEMLGGLVFLLWLIKTERLTRVPEAARNRLWKAVAVSARIGAVVFAAALIASALGYVSIASLVGNALLGSAYVAVIFYAAVRIVDGLIMFSFRLWPLSALGMVRRHRPLLRRRVQRLVRWLATLAWVFYTLELFSLLNATMSGIRLALGARLEVGVLTVSLGNVVAFILTVWLAFLLSRFLRFVLEEDIYPRVSLARGIPYAASTMLHYVILLVGFFFAVAAIGIDMSKFTILAGAFGVGLGFGLQNIVNNFVSGLILLFERPVHVGDMIQVGNRDGKLRRIGIRASVIRTLEGSEVIVPNGQLISEEVMNWTLSDQQRRLEIPVGVAYGTDPERVIKLLTDVGSQHPDIMREPPPDTLFLGFGDSSLDFQLRAWTSNFDRWQNIKSELAIGINAALRDANISIPFPQRDLHILTTPNGPALTPAEEEVTVPIPESESDRSEN